MNNSQQTNQSVVQGRGDVLNRKKIIAHFLGKVKTADFVLPMRCESNE